MDLAMKSFQCYEVAMRLDRAEWQGKWDRTSDTMIARPSFVIESKEVSHDDVDGFYLQPRAKIGQDAKYFGIIGIGKRLGPEQIEELRRARLTVIEEFELEKCNKDDVRLFTGYVICGSVGDRIAQDFNA